ncbi:hypothetical protein IHE44_0007329 [Lamprotornis superbus]|uniref:Uncharacterized protein n=1 Tax=Lamprotornis superbus TaxID=245042 RepID=A0A835TZK3_9PASS|nr:hypothetical protein IHE44_0007329 [Lamprotornis superbus]
MDLLFLFFLCPLPPADLKNRNSPRSNLKFRFDKLSHGSSSMNVSTKGKIFNTPWDQHAPAMGSEVPSPAGCLLHQKRALPLLQSCPGREQHLVTGCPPVQHTPCVQEGTCLCLCCTHTHGQGHVPSWCCAGSPCACPHSPCPWAAWAEGQQERPLQSLGPSVLNLQVGGQAKVSVSGSGAICNRLLFSSLGAVEQNLPGGVLGSSPWSGVCNVSPGIPSSHLHPKTLGQRQPLTPDLPSFLHKRQVSGLAREWSWDCRQLILLGSFVLPALSLPDTEHSLGTPFSGRQATMLQRYSPLSPQPVTFGNPHEMRGCSQGHRAPDSFWRWVQNCAPAPLSGAVGSNHHLPSSLSCPRARAEPSQQKLLCSPWSCRELLPESLTVLVTSVLCSALMNPCGKAAAMMGGEPACAFQCSLSLEFPLEEEHAGCSACSCLRITHFAVQHLSDDASAALSNPAPVLLLEALFWFPEAAR